ncbi:MAG TPA: 50S ribosomal protein L6 [Desulfuromonadales bacterium]|nr:50S ribosomal protein L6 [Desulfuromonadales bacterium]
MSRIGKLPIAIPDGVKVSKSEDTLRVEGPKGTLERELTPGVEVRVESDQVVVNRLSEKKENRALQGLVRSLVANMVQGVTSGFERVLEINGVGYRADVKGEVMNLSLGYSHPIEYQLPNGVTAEVEKQTRVTLRSIDKEILGATAAKIRSFREPEPYKGKGIKYAEETVQRKAGKSGK